MAEAKTAKQRIIEMLGRLPDDIDYARAIEGIYVLQCIEEAREQVQRGEVYDDEDVMRFCASIVTSTVWAPVPRASAKFKRICAELPT